MSDMIRNIKRWWQIDAIGVASILGVSALGYMTLVNPAIENRHAYEAMQPELAQRQQEVQSAKAILASLEKELERTRIELDSLPLRLEPARGVNSRLARIADLASSVGLDVHQMLPDDTRAGQRYDIIPIVLSGSGDFAQVTQFMHDVHDNFADVSVIEFDLAAELGGSQSARFDIGLAWYTLPVMGFVEN